MRKLLDEIIDKSVDNWWKPDFFKLKVLDKLPKKLEILEYPLIEAENYNCFLYALGLAHDKKILKECNGFIYYTFFQKLIDENLLEYTDNPEKGDYIVYRNPKDYPNTITHIGILDENGMIISKWAWGPLVKHNIFDVPESYGDDISYIKMIPKAKAKELYDMYKKFNERAK